MIPETPLCVDSTGPLDSTIYYGEAFVQDVGFLPNGLFHQSNVLTVTIQ